RWELVQQELICELNTDILTTTPPLEKLIHVLDWIDLDQIIPYQKPILGRPSYDACVIARAFIAKALLGIEQTTDLIERLHHDRTLKRICGFKTFQVLPSPATFSRRFADFAESELAKTLHENFIIKHLNDQLIEHICRDATAIHAREKPIKVDNRQTSEQPKRKRGRPKKDVPRPEKEESVISQQRKQNLNTMLAAIPQQCNKGTKCNAQGYKTSWNGYKLHIDTADCGIPISALLSSASVHDSQLAIPLSFIRQQRVTNLYDVMDAAYCSQELRQHCANLNHIPLIDHNPRNGEKIEFCPVTAIRYNIRSVAERSNARLKDEFGGRTIWVKGAKKVYSHLMFGILVLSIDQFMRLRE
ncbi:hypothetical protein GWI33_011369, partial [Rhynchophorus ferrugineus]